MENPELDVPLLVTTVNETNQRVSMHGLRESLLREQVEQTGLPLHIIHLAGAVSMESYNAVMHSEMTALSDQGFKGSVFGDIFLEDLRAYREEQLAQVSLKGIFPLWGMNTRELALQIIESGFKAITVCVNARLLGPEFAGRLVDRQFLEDLPEGVDPCGENGEFHTFVFDGPIFKKPVLFTRGEIVKQGYASNESTASKVSWDHEFWFCDLHK